MGRLRRHRGGIKGAKESVVSPCITRVDGSENNGNALGPLRLQQRVAAVSKKLRDPVDFIPMAADTMFLHDETFASSVPWCPLGSLFVRELAYVAKLIFDNTAIHTHAGQMVPMNTTNDAL